MSDVDVRRPTKRRPSMTRYELESRERHKKPKIWNGDGVEGKQPLGRARCAVREAARAVRDGCRGDKLLHMCWNNKSWNVLNDDVLLEAARCGNRDCAQTIAAHHHHGEGLTKEGVMRASIAAAECGDFDIVEMLSDSININLCCPLSTTHYEIGLASKNAEFVWRLIRAEAPMACSQMEEVTDLVVSHYTGAIADEHQRVQIEMTMMKYVENCLDDGSAEWDSRTPTPELDLDSGVDAYETPDASRIGNDDKEYSAREWR